ncbi:MAG: metallophosphoesterase family protein [Longimicrobiales bacterium]
MIIVHASDLHFGKPHRVSVREALGRFISDTGPGAVVVSGDLTQRAKAEEFRQARAFLDTLQPTPVVTTVGNHDVPLYRVWERLFNPYKQYRNHIDKALDTVADAAGARFVALNTAAPRTQIVNGRLLRSQLEFARRSFQGAPTGATKILVIHHHVMSPGDREPDVPLPNSGTIIRCFHEWGVDLVLSGHLHRSFIKTAAEGLPGGAVQRSLPIVHTGTSTSGRGRGREKGRNSVNLIRVEEMEIEVTVYLYSEDAGRFLPDESHRFPRGVW